MPPEFYDARKVPRNQKRDITYNTGKSAWMLLFNPPKIRKKLSMVRAQRPFWIFRPNIYQRAMNLPLRECASKWTVLTGALETYIAASGGEKVDKRRIDAQALERCCRGAWSH
jgi:hypothetical protein